ncbi:hypothetical protein Vretimale_10827 [Volvox reticuliferus]|uniref:SRCR domain-containing protein n=1 Tax=Volvox reticuliferus TaxID=1737510 RepID=A0A8J4GG09_9CHLO|nr:hypothetical protein Vretimale_10827 [Volvox reticuliferus]
MHFKAFSWAVIWSIHVTMLAPLALAQQTGLKPPLAWSCDNCPDFINPVCADGVTFRHRCIAECQKIMNAQDGACKGDDLLQQARWQGRKAPPDSTTGVEAIMTSSSAAGGAADAAAQQQLLGGSGKTSKSTIDIGTTGAEVTASIMARFHAEGLVYVGSLALHDGPSNNNWTYEQLKTRMGNDLEGQQGSADNGVGSVADQAQVRAIRYSVSDGSFYFEASPRLTDLWTIIPKAARRNLLRKNDDAIPLGATAEAGAAEGVDSPCENGSSTTTTTTTTNTTTATINNDNNHKRTQACTHRGSTNGSVNVTNSAAVAAAVAAAMSPGISSSKDKTNSLDRRIGQHRRALGEEPWRAPQSSSVYPFSALAFIRYPTAKGMNRCTGTFVSPWDVLTAAHCVWDFFDSTGYSDWIIYPGLDNATTLNGRTSLAPEYVTFYRTENMNTTAGKIYSSSSIRNAVNYFDIAVIRLKSPHTSWLGIKYDCARASYPKTLACSYPNDNTGMFASLCVQCFISTSQCRPLWMMYNYCYSRPGSSGMGIMDLNDLRVVGVLSGGEGDDWDYSYSTPIDAFHFNNLVRWIWPSSPPSPNRPPPPPVVVIRPPPPKPSPPAPSLRSTPLVSLSPKKVAQQTSSNSEDVISPNPPNGGGDNIETPAPPHGQSVPPSPHPQPPLQPSQPVSFPDERYLLKKEQQQQGQGDWAAAPPEGDPTNLSQPAFPNGPPVKGGIPPSPGFGVTGIGDGSDQRSGVEDSTQSEASNTNTNSAPSSINIKSTSVSAQLTAAPSPSKPCIDGQLRLMDGWSSWSGRLEICNSSGVWGTICDVGWTWDDARVACRQLGYPAGGEAIQGGLFPGAAASVPMHYGGITCLGSEGMLTKCDFPDSMPRACYSVDKNNNTVVDHKYDAGLMCVPDGSVATPPVSGATNGSNSWQPGDYPCPSDNSLRLAPGTVTSGNRGTGNAGAWISGRLECLRR